MTFKLKIENAKTLIRKQLDKYPNAGIALSWGKDSMVLFHLVFEVEPKALFFSIFSDTEFSETASLRSDVITRFNVRNYKEFSFKQSGKADNCCRKPKVALFKQIITDLKLECWFSGLRADENETRNGFKEVETKNGLIKVNPLLNFTEKDIYRYLAVFSVPINPLYLEYRSLSCSLCSAKEVDEKEGERIGRWKGLKDENGKSITECGLHSQNLKA